MSSFNTRFKLFQKVSLAGLDGLKSLPSVSDLSQSIWTKLDYDSFMAAQS